LRAVVKFVSESFHVIMKFLTIELYIFQDSWEGKLINVRSQSLENVFNVVKIQILLNYSRLRAQNLKGVMRRLIFNWRRKIFIDDKEYARYLSDVT